MTDEKIPLSTWQERFMDALTAASKIEVKSITDGLVKAMKFIAAKSIGRPPKQKYAYLPAGSVMHYAGKNSKGKPIYNEVPVKYQLELDNRKAYGKKLNQTSPRIIQETIQKDNERRNRLTLAKHGATH